MAINDWADVIDAPSTTQLRRLITGASPTAPLTGSGIFAWGANPMVDGPLTFAKFVQDLGINAGYSPTAPGRGGRASAAVMKAPGTGASIFVAALVQSTQMDAPVVFPSSAGVGYLLGLTSESPARIALVKGPLSGGVPPSAPGTNGVLARGSEDVAAGTWVHLRLDARVNGNGDVCLRAFRNVTGLVLAPDWQPIPGIPWVVIDDALGVNSGSAPLQRGFFGFGQHFTSARRPTYVDHAAAARQLG